MLRTIVDSYKLFFKKFPIILLYAVPLLVIASLQLFFEGLNAQNSGVIYYIAVATFIMPLISAATDVAVYRRLFGYASSNPFANLKTLFVYMFVQLGLGLVAVLPIFLLNLALLQYWPNPHGAMLIALLANMFLGIYFLARFNIVLPLIVQERVPAIKDFVTYTDFSYRQWMQVAFLVYLPYILINYLFSCPYLHIALTNLFMLMFVCFNTVYVMTNRLPSSPAVDPLLVRKEPVMSKPKPQPKAEKTPVAKPVAKPATPAAKPQKAPAKKPAAPKKAPKPGKPSFEPA